MSGTVYLVGAGPGDPDLMTVRALRLITTVGVVVHDRLVSPEIMALIPPRTRLVAVGKKAGSHPVPQDGINALLVRLAQEGHDVVRLKGGDPLIFGRGSEEAAALAAAGIPHSHVPGITAAQGAAAATGVPLTHRGLASGVRYVTGHRAEDGPLGLDWRALADPDTTLVVYMGAGAIARIAAQLIAHGLPVDLPVLAVSHATTVRQVVLRSSLARIGADMAAARMEAPVLFIIGHVASLADAASHIAPMPLAQVPRLRVVGGN